MKAKKFYRPFINETNLMNEIVGQSDIYNPIE